MTHNELPFNPANVHDIDGEFGEIYIPPAAISAHQFHRQLGSEAVAVSFDELIDIANQTTPEA